MQLSERALRFWLGLLAFALCLVVSGGHLHNIDGYSIVTTAVNIVQHGELTMPQFGWAQWVRPGEEMGALNDSGDLYAKKSPLVIALMTPLVAVGRLLPRLGVVGAALLLNPLITALTAVLLYTFARRLGWARAVSLAAALAFLLSTMALVYSKLTMGEPVASLGLLLGLFGVHLASEQPRPATLLGSALLCGIGLALAVGSTAVYVIFAPLFATALVAANWKKASAREQATILICFSLPLVAIGMALAGYNYLRFGNPLQTGYHFAAGQEGFTTPLWWGAPGLTLSPARGFLWYNPPALLALLGWPALHRARRLLSFTMLAVVAAHLVTFGSWWQWWGGYGWGPRFLLPVVPIVMLAVLPMLDAARRYRPLKFLTAGILLAGFGVQVAGVVIDYTDYEAELDRTLPSPASQPLLYHHDPTVVYDVARSPILVHFQRLSTSQIDLAWWPRQQPQKSAPGLIAAIQSEQRPGDAVLYLAPELLDPFLTAPNMPLTYGLPVNVSPTDALAQKLFARSLRDAQRVWLITWYGPGDPGNWYEAELRQTWASLSEETLDGYRLIRFARPPEDSGRAASVSFGPIQLTGYNAQARSDTLFVELRWQAQAPPPDNYVTFVHVIGPDGSLLAGQDRQPLGGYRVTTAWEVGETVMDRFAFSLDSTQVTEARIEVGWYSWPSLERLQLADGGDSFPLVVAP